MDTKNTGNIISDRYKIKVSNNGPYLVSGRILMTEQIIGINAEGYPCEWYTGTTYPVQNNYTLCRCGSSNRKPFCDGTHAQVKFDGTESASRKPYLKQADKISGLELELNDAIILCALARFCERAGGIWDLVKKPDRSDARDIAIEEAGNCPSGRLMIWNKNGYQIEPKFEPSIGLVEDPQEEVQGPIWVRGKIPVESANGTTYEIRNRITLCRCGISSNKPFCDGSHCNTESKASSSS